MKSIFHFRSFPVGPLFVELLALATLAGCGGSAESTVSGRVTLDGVPLQRGTVVFSPLSSEGRSASGSIDEEGNYQLQAAQTGGMPAGEYEVTISSREPAIPNSHGGPPRPGKLITPQRYRQPDLSGLSFEVQPGSNDVNWELTKKDSAKTGKKAKR